mmetsp:Transcript_1977/g.8722  ORF Transcript_1977/g.8722 Transcript_1977/m.8722 type:complete len:213 (+) Transcript_1977:646-1284(+)
MVSIQRGRSVKSEPSTKVPLPPMVTMLIIPTPRILMHGKQTHPSVPVELKRQPHPSTPASAPELQPQRMKPRVGNTLKRRLQTSCRYAKGSSSTMIAIWSREGLEPRHKLSRSSSVRSCRDKRMRLVVAQRLKLVLGSGNGSLSESAQSSRIRQDTARSHRVISEAACESGSSLRRPITSWYVSKMVPSTSAPAQMPTQHSRNRTSFFSSAH